MAEVSTYRRTLAALGFFTLAAGDALRFLLSWWGWGAIVAVLLVLAVIELVRMRFDVRRLPVTLLAFLTLILVSIAWSAYPAWTAVAVVASLVTTTFGVFLAVAFDLRTLLRCLGSALRWILGLSLGFELFVSVVIRRPVLPLFPAPGIDYAEVHKIPAAFYWSRDLLLSGGRIQGIVGNANLLAFAALLALLVFAIQFAAGSASRFWLGCWGLVAVGVLVLTRSGTVLVAGAAVLTVGAFLAIVRHAVGRARRLTYLGGAGVLVLVGAAAAAAHEPLLALLGKSDTLTGRTDIWHTVLHYAGQRPVAGWGWISYWVPTIHPFDDPAFTIGRVQYSQAHDAWLDVLLQLGVIGLVVFGLLVLTTLLRSWVLAVDTGPGRSVVGVFPLLVLVLLLVQSIAESRILIEIGFALLVMCSVLTARLESRRGPRSHPPVPEPVGP